jgi:hypothetical protein
MDVQDPWPHAETLSKPLHDPPLPERPLRGSLERADSGCRGVKSPVSC